MIKIFSVKYYFGHTEFLFSSPYSSFYQQVCFADSPWFLVEISSNKNSRKLTSGRWLFGASWWRAHVSLFLLKEGAQRVSSQTFLTVARIGIWPARLSIHWHRVMSSPIVYALRSMHFFVENQIFICQVLIVVGFFID